MTSEALAEADLDTKITLSIPVGFVLAIVPIAVAYETIGVKRINDMAV
ncbi:hypothetical protein ID856_02125 [Xenorhabdus sp. 18]|nr:hypothetical protein [Xenorhabdus sp. 18]MBD2795336.1 hypothetical protein [Xenorhabdus sp. 18]